jgi:hypothetical protein
MTSASTNVGAIKPIVEPSQKVHTDRNSNSRQKPGSQSSMGPCVSSHPMQVPYEFADIGPGADPLLADPPIALSRLPHDGQLESLPNPVLNSIQQAGHQTITASPGVPDSARNPSANHPLSNWPVSFGWPPAPGQAADLGHPAPTAMSFPRPMPKFMQDTVFGFRIGVSPYPVEGSSGPQGFGTGSQSGSSEQRTGFFQDGRLWGLMPGSVGEWCKSSDKNDKSGSTEKVFTGTATKFSPPVLTDVLCGLLFVAGIGMGF